ncbi:MAG: MmgE/PrpD family protein [Sphingomonas sp.]
MIAVSVPGAADPAARIVFESVRPWGEGPATAIGFGASLAAPWAALVNGTAAHALDFDDNFDPAKAHATAVLVPAILALAEQEGRVGRGLRRRLHRGLADPRPRRPGREPAAPQPRLARPPRRWARSAPPPPARGCSACPRTRRRWRCRCRRAWRRASCRSSARWPSRSTPGSPPRRG